MDPLEESLDAGKWCHKDIGQVQKEYREYQVMRQHKQMDPTSYRYVIQKTEGDDEPKGVVVEFTSKDKDPLKDIGTAELRLKDNKVVGINLDGDCMELK